ncbi:AAA family ATPase [Thermodesulfobacteriota bacterium]
MTHASLFPPDIEPDVFEKILDHASQYILGKRLQLQLALCCILAEGHLLIEDIPGIGKTTLAKMLAHLLGLDFQRVQCTSDMLPGDILGFSVFNRDSGTFSFHPGPIFTQVLLTDEINRTPPKTQSALLEAMEEKQVSFEGKTRDLPSPFFVIATQNPLEQSGTYPLPESQLDRFLFRLEIGYPDREAEHELLAGGGVASPSASIAPFLSADKVLSLQQLTTRIQVVDPLIKYIQDIIDFTRHSGTFTLGLSPRAGLLLLRSAKAWALLNSRDFVLPEDVQMVLPYIARHRLRKADTHEEVSTSELAEIFQSVAVPI